MPNPKVSMQYGSGNYTAQNFIMNGGGSTGPAITFVTGNTLEDGTTTDTLPIEAGKVYLLFSVEYAHSSKTYRGGHVRYITAPQSDKWGSEQSQVGGIYGSSASGITITANNNSTVTVKQTSSTYDVKYSLYEVEMA